MTRAAWKGWHAAGDESATWSKHGLLMQMAKTMKPEETILINLSGRGDKDMLTVAKIMGVDMSDT